MRRQRNSEPRVLAGLPLPPGISPSTQYLHSKRPIWRYIQNELIVQPLNSISEPMQGEIEGQRERERERGREGESPSNGMESKQSVPSVPASLPSPFGFSFPFKRLLVRPLVRSAPHHLLFKIQIPTSGNEKLPHAVRERGRAEIGDITDRPAERPPRVKMCPRHARHPLHYSLHEFTKDRAGRGGWNLNPAIFFNGTNPNSNSNY